MISVIIATRGRAASLAQTLAAIVSQDGLGIPFEILVVDNGPDENTRRAVEAAARQRMVPVRYLLEPAPGKSHALNHGVAHARGDLLVLTDDDVLPAGGWLAAYLRALEETGADFAVGRILPLWGAEPPAWLSPALYGVLAVPDGGTTRLLLAKGRHEEIMPIGANMALRRRVLERIGGWNPDLGKLQGTLRTGEDHEYALRMLHAGFTGVYEPAAWVRHRVPADRLRYAYFHRWYVDNGAIQAGFEDEFPTGRRYVLKVPVYLWREAVNNLLDIVIGAATLDLPRAAAAELRLAWFVGYVRARWTSRRASRSLSAPTVVLRS